MPGAANPRAGRITWGQWQQTWWPKRRVEEGTAARDESRRHVHLEPKWAAWPLDEITREDVQDWVDSLAARDDLSASTVRKIYHLMSASMKAAALARKIPATPCLSIELPRLPPPDERYLTHDEVDAVVHFMDPKWATLILLLAGTGLRWGEMVGLHWQRVHLDAQRIDVTMAWDTKRRRWKLPKDHEKRSVPILDWVEGELVRHRVRHPAGTYCGVGHPAWLGQRCTSSLVIPGRTGGPVSYNSFHHGPWEQTVGRWVWRTPAGRTFSTQAAAHRTLGEDAELIRGWQAGPAGIAPCTIHDLRHTFASWYLQDGGTIEELSGLLGHSSILVTQRYAHLAPDRWSKIRERMSGKGPRGTGAPVSPQNDLGNVFQLGQRGADQAI
jgi:integrase